MMSFPALQTSARRVRGMSDALAAPDNLLPRIDDPHRSPHLSVSSSRRVRSERFFLTTLMKEGFYPPTPRSVLQIPNTSELNALFTICVVFFHVVAHEPSTSAPTSL